MKYILLLFLFLFLLFSILFPVFALADTYQGEAGSSQMVADSFGQIYTFFFTDIPNLFHRFTAWIIVWMVKAQLYAQLELMKYSWSVAKVLISDLNIMTEINSQMSLLPEDLRKALSDMHFLDGLTLILNAYMTKFVMNFLRF